ncbi:MAG TPA: SDR family NAD(P)-dependent oxidoreductase [Dehalococcoidia bacterium]|jgi:NAD(P)-dependent dehydrogenase (short-subunit alcohol dehydrogenase family)|nr:SDR family NAD(P)-dependent oxidoreductase [Dehalococcoidia bacterium]
MSASFSDRFSLDGQVATVTGGGKGLGEAACLALADAGASIVVQDIDGGAAHSVASEISATGGTAISVSGDITDEATIDNVIDRATDELGRLDIMVNAAGIYTFIDMLSMSIGTWDQIINLHLRAAFLCNQKAGLKMAELGNGGAILNLSSVQGLRPSNPGALHYDSAKAGVIMLTKAAALELAPHKVRVNAIAPGLTVTPGTQAVVEQGGDNMVARVPLGRLGKAEDIGNLILFLVGPAADYITGETVVIDGGYLLT